MSAAKKLTGDRKKIFTALVYLKNTDRQGYSRAIRAAFGAPLKNPPESDEEIEALVARLDASKIQALKKKDVIRRAISEMGTASPERRLELSRMKRDSESAKRRIEKDIQKIVRELSLKIAESKGKIVDSKSEKIAELSIKAHETTDAIESIDSEIAAIRNAAKGERRDRLFPLYQKKDSLIRVSENIAKQQRSLVRGMRRELLKADFAGGRELDKIGAGEPGVARILADRVQILSQMDGASGSKLKELQTHLSKIDKELKRADEIYNGLLSVADLKRLSTEYVDISPQATRQIALRHKLETAAVGATRSDELQQIRNKISQINQDIANEVLDTETKDEMIRRRNILNEMRDERRFESRVLELVADAIKRKNARPETEKRSKYQPADRDLYLLAKQILETITETAKSVGNHYANCLRAMDTVHAIIGARDRALLNKGERMALKALGRQRSGYIRLIKNETNNLSKDRLIYRTKRQVSGIKNGTRAFDRMMKMYFGMTPDALAVVSAKKAGGDDPDVSGFNKILGIRGRVGLGAAYIYGIALYLNEVPSFPEEKLPGGVFVHPPLTTSTAGIEAGYRGVRGRKERSFTTGLDLLPPWRLMGAYREAYDRELKESLWAEAKGDTLSAKVAKNFIRGGLDGFEELAIRDDEGRFVKKADLSEEERSSRDLYFRIKRKSQRSGLLAAEKKASEDNDPWSLPQREYSRGELAWKPETLIGFDEFEIWETHYENMTESSWIKKLKGNQKLAATIIYADVLGGEMLGDITEAAGESMASEETDFSLTSIYVRPPIFRGKAWTVADPKSKLSMMGSAPSDPKSKNEIRIDLAFAIKTFLAAESGRPLTGDAVAWLLLRKPWMSPELAKKINTSDVAEADAKELAEYLGSLPEKNPNADNLATQTDVKSEFIFSNLESLSKSHVDHTRSLYERAIVGVVKEAAKEDLAQAEREYAEAKALSSLARKLKVQLANISPGPPYWAYILRDPESGEPLAMGYALDKSGATKMARKRDQLIYDINAGALTFASLSQGQRRLLLSPSPGTGKYLSTYISPQILNALFPSQGDIKEAGDATHKKLVERTATFTAIGDIKKTGIESAVGTGKKEMFPQKKGDTSIYEPDDDAANYSIEVKAIDPGKAYAVRAVFYDIDNSGNRSQSKTDWVTIYDNRLSAAKNLGKKMYNRYKRSISSQSELEKNPAICKCLATGEYMAGVRNGSNAFMAEYSKNPKAAISKYTRKSNPATKDITDVFQGADFSSDTQRIPSDPNKAYGLGYAEGIVDGMGLCGAKNFFARKKLKRDYEKAILDARTKMRQKLTGIQIGPQAAAPVIEVDSDDYYRNEYS